jgi:LysR family hydrogen peroxide-inducible transcriptional activator
MPTISQLSYILAVNKSGHFGRAAKSVGVSQPTLSAQIHKVEDELGFAIFDRQARPTALTERGAALIEHAQAVVSAHENLLRLAAGELDDVSGEFSLGIIPTLAPYVLPWFLQHFAERHPGVKLAVVERPTDDILELIGQSQLDAGILATPLHETSIHEMVLFYDPFYLYAQADEDVLDVDELDVDTLDPKKLWLLEDGHCVRAQVINFCGIDERVHLGSVTFSAGSFETIRNLIDSSQGYTVVPETYARKLPRTARQANVRAFAGRTPTREVSLVHHRMSWKTDILAALEESIRKNIPRSLRQVGADGEVLSIR